MGAIPLHANESADHLKPYRKEVKTRYLLRVGTSNLKLSPSVSAGGIESVELSDDTVKVTYAGLGGGGVGATCAAR